MSLQQARAFCLELILDRTLRERIEAAPDAASRRTIMRESGFKFSANELETVIADASQAETAEDLLKLYVPSASLRRTPGGVPAKLTKASLARLDQEVAQAFSTLVGLQKHQLVALYFDGPPGQVASAFFKLDAPTNVLSRGFAPPDGQR